MQQRKLPSAVLVRYLTSRDPVLRQRAETTLYHIGPDSGAALFAAAEFVSHRFSFHYATHRFLISLAALGVFLFGVSFFVNPDVMRMIWYPMAGGALVQACWNTFGEQQSRRNSLKLIGLALSKRNDLRAIGPLLEAWRPQTLLGRSVPDNDVEEELMRLLPQFLAQQSMELRTYKRKNLRAKVDRLFIDRPLGRGVAAKAEISDLRSDLLVAVLQILARSGGSSIVSSMRRISRLNATNPNEQCVREAAAHFLHFAAEKPENARSHSFPFAVYRSRGAGGGNSSRRTRIPTGPATAPQSAVAPLDPKYRARVLDIPEQQTIDQSRRG